MAEEVNKENKARGSGSFGKNFLSFEKHFFFFFFSFSDSPPQQVAVGSENERMKESEARTHTQSRAGGDLPFIRK